ncbi:SRPBCC domain-containing protein [Actinosynnema sp. NPDC050436]|uniref:SRPBCC family protein n=1 Tax=Actinosynnema sp. NPDC050436 TaxID=3155659 RepID=UPI0034063180
MTAGVRTIEVDEFLPHPARRVWRALVDPGELARWFVATDFRPEVGHHFTLDTGPWGATRCVVTAVEVERLLRYTWRNGPLDTVVTWRLVPEGTGTRVLLEHHGFDLDDPAQRRAFNGMGGGWRSAVLARLADHLAESGGPRT